MESREAAEIRRQFDRAVAMTMATITTLRKMEDEYGLDYSDEESSVNLLRKALRQQVEDRNYLLEFVKNMEVEA